jgi:hypothetical protein
MGFRKLGGSANYVKAMGWKQWNKGDYIVGEFDNVDHQDKFGNPIYGIKVDKASFPVTSGELIHINSGGNLKNLMNEVSLGDIIKVQYNGKAKITKGKWTGTETHDIAVELFEDSSKPSDDLI